MAADNHFSRDVLPKNNAGFGVKTIKTMHARPISVSGRLRDRSQGPGDLPVQRAGVNYSLVTYLKDRQGARADRAARNLGLADEVIENQAHQVEYGPPKGERQ